MKSIHLIESKYAADLQKKVNEYLRHVEYKCSVDIIHNEYEYTAVIKMGV
jgi:hypothetical protein